MKVNELQRVLAQVDPSSDVMLVLSEGDNMYGAEMAREARRDPRWPDRLIIEGYAEPLGRGLMLMTKGRGR